MMKIIFMVLFLINNFVYSQFFENFDDSLNIPNNWAIFKGENEAGNNLNNWTISNSDGVSKNNSAFVRYENSGKINEDWLVSPKIDLGNYRNCFLTFIQHNSFIANSTKYEIKISTSSQFDRSTFKTIEIFDDTTFYDIFSLKKINLSAYDSQQIYIAFVKTEDDGNNWYIDDISVKGDLINSFLKGKIIFSPNPTSGKLVTKIKIKTLNITNLDGKPLNAYTNVDSIDISHLPNGVYLLNIQDENGKVFIQKIIKL